MLVFLLLIPVLERSLILNFHFDSFLPSKNARQCNPEWYFYDRCKMFMDYLALLCICHSELSIYLDFPGICKQHPRTLGGKIAFKKTFCRHKLGGNWGRFYDMNNRHGGYVNHELAAFDRPHSHIPPIDGDQIMEHHLGLGSDVAGDGKTLGQRILVDNVEWWAGDVMCCEHGHC